MNLRPYQLDAVNSTAAGFQTYRKQLGVLATGGGKTIVFSHIADARRQQGQRTLILAHRSELIEQAADKLHKATGIVADIEKADRWASKAAPVVVASVQTMQGDRLQRWAPDHFGLVVVDEAHHAISPQFRSVLTQFDTHAHVLGVTATPDRGDKRNLGEYFENIAFEVGLFDLIPEYLSPITIKSVPLEIDLSKVNQTAGDYDPSQVGDALMPYLEQIARAIMEHASFRRVLVFMPLIATSKAFVEVCQRLGMTAAHVDGYDPDRKETLQRFAAGEFDLLSNAMLLTEGYDDPGIDCVVNLRPTRSRSLYSQIVGRGTRKADTKTNLLLLDFLWSHQRMNLVRPAHLVAGSEEEAEVITKLAEDKSAGGATQEDMDLQALATESTEKRHEALRKKLEEHRNKKATTFDAAEWCLKMGQPDLCDYEPTMKWERDTITVKQAAILKRAKIDLQTVTGKGHANRLIDVWFRSQKLTLASESQRGLMKRMGNPNWQTATAADARTFFATLNKRKAA
jgi:superfamily II DNA or RNA helicase